MSSSDRMMRRTALPNVVWMRKRLPKDVHAERDLEREEHRRTDDRPKEVPVVLLPHAVVQPLAVVIKHCDALVTEAAVAALFVPIVGSSRKTRCEDKEHLTSSRESHVHVLHADVAVDLVVASARVAVDRLSSRALHELVSGSMRQREMQSRRTDGRRMQSSDGSVFVQMTTE